MAALEESLAAVSSEELGGEGDGARKARQPARAGKSSRSKSGAKSGSGSKSKSGSSRSRSKAKAAK
jgi:hypothetical protein